MSRPRLHRRRKSAELIRLCPANWQLHHSCSDGRGHAVCPLCAATVDVEDVQPGVVRLCVHALIVTETRGTNHG